MKKTWEVSSAVKANKNIKRYVSEANARTEFTQRLEDGHYHSLATLENTEWIWVEKGDKNCLEVRGAIHD